MLEGKIERQYFALDGPLIKFYGQKAMSIDGTFAVHQYGNVYVEYKTDIIREMYEFLLFEDELNGRIADIARLHLSPLAAAAFCHIDYLPPEKLFVARESATAITMEDVELVGLEGRGLTVCVFSGMENIIATADAKGRIIA